MYELNKKTFKINLEKLKSIQEVKNYSYQTTMIKKLFLVLAGDENLIKKLTLDDFLEIINSSTELINIYNDICKPSFDISKLRYYKVMQRRAL